MPLVQTVPPAVEPVSLQDVKEIQPAIEHDKDDRQLTRLIVAARQHVENILWRQLITATYVLTLRQFPNSPGTWDGGAELHGMPGSLGFNIYGHEGKIWFPRPPLIAISSFTFIDPLGNTETLASNQYLVDATHEPGTVEPPYGQFWPFTEWTVGAVTITYTAGYGSTPDSVPAAIREGIIRVVRWCYDHGSMFSTKDLPMGMTAFLEDFKFRAGDKLLRSLL